MRINAKMFSLLVLFILSPLQSYAADLSIISALPQGEVDNLTQITVRFSEDMRPLGAMEQDPASSPMRINASPDLPKGNYRWLDTATLSYLFDEPLTYPVNLKINIPAGTASLSGAVLPKDYSWKINTPPLDVRLNNEKLLPPKNAQFYMNSNYELDLESLKKNISVTLDNKPLSLEIDDVSYRYTYQQGQQSTWSYQISIKDELPAGKRLHFNMSNQATTASGQVKVAPIKSYLSTWQPLKVKNWHADYSDKNTLMSPEGNVAVSFNNPLHYKELMAHLKVTPEPSMIKSEDDADNEDSHASAYFTLPYDWAPRTTYSVAISPGLTDVYGSVMGKESKFTFKTGDYHPLFYMVAGKKVLERSLGGLFPMVIRNINSVKLTLRYLPWESDFSAKLLSDQHTDSDTFKKLPGAIERTLTFDYSKRQNENLREILNIPELLGFSSAQELKGPVYLHAELPKPKERQGYWYNDNYVALLQITDLGINARLGQDKSLAWITGLDSGEALNEADLILIGKEGKKLWQGKTGKEGLAEMPGLKNLPEAPFYLLVKSASDAALLDFEEASLPSGKEYSIPLTGEDRHWNIHMISQMPLYQPGQEVRYTVYARAVTDNNGDSASAAPDWQALADKEINLTVTDSRGKEIHTQTATTDKYGAVSGSFPLDQEANLGRYHLLASVEGLKQQRHAQAFEVASFRPPDFKVDLTAPSDQPKPAAPFTVGLSASYFSGAALPGAQAALATETEEISFVPPPLAGYKTGIDAHPFFRGVHFMPDEYGQRLENIAPLTATLDNDGKAVFILPEIPVKPGITQNINFEATVTDPSGLTSQGNAAFVLHPSAFYVGIRAPFFIPMGKDAPVSLKAASWDGKALSNVKVHLKAERVKDGKAEETVWEKDIRLDAELGQEVSVSFAKAGVYYLTATIKDERGRENISRILIYVPGADGEWIRLRPGANLEILTDKESYAPGDTVKLTCSNPLGKAQALITVERDGIREYRLENVSEAMPTFELPLSAKDAPYVFVSITLIRGRNAPPPEAEEYTDSGSDADAGGPRVLHAVTRLEVKDPSDKGTRISVATDRQQYRPGEEVKVTVKTTDFSGQALKRQITLLAVDDRVLRASGENLSYDPSRTFGKFYPYNMRNSDIRNMLLNLNLPILNQLQRPRKASLYAVAPEQSPMADMAAAGGFSAEIETRENFTPMAFWLPAKETDSSGALHAVFKLPDTLTSYRIVAIAADDKSSFIEGQNSITVSKPLQVLSALPKFVTQGDRLDAGILVQNLGDSAGTVTVNAQSSDLVITEGSRTLSLKAGESALAVFPLRAEATGLASLRIEAQMGSEKDAARFVLPVKPALPLTTIVATAGMLKKGEVHAVSIKVPLPLDARSKLAVIFAPSPAAGLSLTADYLLAYPWNCLEQRLSKAWVRAIRLSDGELIGLRPETDDKEIIQSTLKSVEKFQKYDGGLGLWEGMSDSNYYLTVYALLADRQMRPIDLSMPSEVKSRAYDYIKEQLDGNLKLAGKNSRHSLETDALAVWLLAAKDQRHAITCFDKILTLAEKNKANPMTWAALLLAAGDLPELPEKESKIDRIIVALEKNAVITPTQLHFSSNDMQSYWMTMGSPLRDNGLVLGALAAVRPKYPRLEALAYWVSQETNEREYLSTQEAIFGLWGLVSYLKTLGGNQTTALKAEFNGQETVTKIFKRLIEPPESWIIPAATLGKSEQTELVLIALEGTPYWTTRMTYASASCQIKPENAGFTISHEWKTPGPWKIGDLVEVVVKLRVPASRRHVLLFDPFPAGLEPLYASRADLASAGQTYQYPWQWQESRADGMLLYAERVDPGTYTYTYTLRAAAAGTFVQRPSYAEEMYMPEVFGRTGTEIVTVRQ